LEYLEIPPPPVDIISPLPAITIWLAIATAGFLMLIFMKIRRIKAKQSTGRWQSLRRSIHPAGIAFLVLFSIILMAPYITGSLEGSFIPVEREESFDSGPQLFALHLIDPIYNLEIGAGIEETSYRFIISAHYYPEMRYQMMIQDSLGSVLLEATHINSTAGYRIEGETTAGANYTLMLARSDSNVEIGFSYELIKTVIKPDIEPTMSTYGAIAGVGILLLAILLGLIIEVDDEPMQS
jgi:hypothetical protein